MQKLFSSILGFITDIITSFIWKHVGRFFQTCFDVYYIKDKDLKNYVKSAKKYLKSKNYKDCAVNIGYSFNLFETKIRKAIKNASEFGDLTYLTQPFDNLISKNIVNMDILEYKRFIPWVPQIITFENGGKRVRIKRSYETDDTEEFLKFCLKILIKAILDNQNKFSKITM